MFNWQRKAIREYLMNEHFTGVSSVRFIDDETRVQARCTCPNRDWLEPMNSEYVLALALASRQKKRDHAAANKTRTDEIGAIITAAILRLDDELDGYECGRITIDVHAKLSAESMIFISHARQKTTAEYDDWINRPTERVRK